MADRRPRNCGLFATALLLCLLASWQTCAQQTPTLDDILTRLEANLHNYETTIPGFFCDEHVVSTMIPSVGNQDVISDGIFRLKRTINPDQTFSLDESRQIRTVNGKPATGDDLIGPALLKGAFSGGLAVVSLNQKACMRYSLRPIKPAHPDAPYVVQFESLYDFKHPSGCLLQEDGSGRAFIDPHTMQITHMELTAPHHILYRPTAGIGLPPPPVTVVWMVTVDYAPVLLGGRTFWMPSNITSIASNLSIPGSILAVWSFKARYSNYHKLEVTSRIVPPDESSPQ